jgi:hypothetical protein
VYKFNYINLAFTIGTIFNILVILDDKKNPSENNINYKMIAGMYQFILVMQLFDFVVWNDMQCKSGGKTTTKGAFVATVLQPVFIIILFLLFTQETDITKKLFAFVCLLVYLGVILYMFYYNPNNIKAIDCMYIKDKFSEMYYKWTDNLHPYGKLSHITSISISMALLLKSKMFAGIHILFFVGSYLLSRSLYKCGMPSIWCLYACGGPLVNYILMKNKI